MNVGLAFNPAAFATVGSAPSQAKINQQVAMTGASAAYNAQDRLVKDSHRSASLKLVGSRVGQKKVLDKAGVTKPSSVKKGG